MTAAVQFPCSCSTCSVPDDASVRRAGTSEPLATVTILAPPRDLTAAPALRLTRRGVAAVAVVVGVLGAALVSVALRSAPAAGARAVPPPAVTVRSGDTLWAIAARVAPAADPRLEVAALMRRNALATPDLLPGQVLRVS